MRRFWVDFENAPHVPVLLPIIKMLEDRGFTPIMSARDFSFTRDLLDEYNLEARVIGGGATFSNLTMKSIAILWRALLLARAYYKFKKDVCFSLSHGSRSQILAAHMLGITVVSMEDYEHSNQFHNRYADYLLAPDCIPKSAFPDLGGVLIGYPGIKENIYLDNIRLTKKVPDFLRKYRDKTIILFRPEGRTAHYRSDHSQDLQEEVLRYLGGLTDVCILVYPRDEYQRNIIAGMLKEGKAQYLFPPITSGPDLILAVDLLIGGGGTMTREAALLGVPSYSFFSGKWGAVDRKLQQSNKLNKIEDTSDIFSIKIEKRKFGLPKLNSGTLEYILDFLASFGNDM